MTANPELQVKTLVGSYFDSDSIFENNSSVPISTMAIDINRRTIAWAFQNVIYMKPIDQSSTVLKSPGNYSISDDLDVFQLDQIYSNQSVTDLGIDSVTGNIYITLVSDQRNLTRNLTPLFN